MSFNHQLIAEKANRLNSDDNSDAQETEFLHAVEAVFKRATIHSDELRTLVDMVLERTTVEAFAEASTVCSMTIWRFRNEECVPNRTTLGKISKAIINLITSLYPALNIPTMPKEYKIRFIRNKKVIKPSQWKNPGSGASVSAEEKSQYSLLTGVFQLAIRNALQQGSNSLRRLPFPAMQKKLPEAIISQNRGEGTTNQIDLVTSQAIFDVIELAYNNAPKDHPLAFGFHYIDEERGYKLFRSKVNPEVSPLGISLVILIDPTSDSNRAARGIGGTTAISAYKFGEGWVSAAVGDFNSNTIYYRTAGSTSESIQLLRDSDDNARNGEQPDLQSLKGVHSLLRVTPNGSLNGVEENVGEQKVRRNVAINLYTTKFERMAKTLELGSALLRKMEDNAVHFSEGGARGPILVAASKFDASVEFVKGFRPLDFYPGGFIAQGAGAAVIDPDGTTIDFDDDTDFENAIESLAKKFDNKRFDQLRRKFIVASNRALANEIAECLAE